MHRSQPEAFIIFILEHQDVFENAIITINSTTNGHKHPVPTVNVATKACHVPVPWIFWLLVLCAETNSKHVLVLWISWYLVTAADIWCGDHEQHALLGGFLGTYLHKRLDLELLIWIPHHPSRLHCDGPLYQLPHHIPSVDLLRGVSALPTVSGDCLYLGLRFRLVVDHQNSCIV